MYTLSLKTSFYSLPFFVLQLLGAQLRRFEIDNILVQDEGAQAKVLMPREGIVLKAKALSNQFMQRSILLTACAFASRTKASACSVAMTTSTSSYHGRMSPMRYAPSRVPEVRK